MKFKAFTLLTLLSFPLATHCKWWNPTTWSYKHITLSLGITTLGFIGYYYWNQQRLQKLSSSFYRALTLDDTENICTYLKQYKNWTNLWKDIEKRFSPIITAAYINNQEAFSLLINSKLFNINRISDNEDKDTALHVALKKKNYAVAKMLLEDETIQLNIKNADNQTPEDICRKNINESEPYSQSKKEAQEVLNILINQKYNLLLKTLESIHNADDIRILSTLYGYQNFIINNAKQLEKNFLPLHYFAHSFTNKNLIILEKLLHLKCFNINFQDDLGNTALHSATKKVCVEAVRRFMKYGANSNIENNEGKTSFNNAQNNFDKAYFSNNPAYQNSIKNNTHPTQIILRMLSTQTNQKLTK